MTEERQPESTGEATGSTGEQPVVSGAKSVEEVEAFWQHRFSQRDIAHNAEAAALKAQIAAMEKAPAAPPPDESPEAVQVRELRAALAAEQQARVTAELSARYPQTSGVLGDTIGVLPEAKIAAMEAALGVTPQAPMVDPNMAPRQMGNMSQKPESEKTKEELLADLRRLAPAFQQAAKEGLIG